MQSEHLAELRKQLEAPRFVLDLNELTLVDIEVVPFLSACEQQGLNFLHCPRYLSEWMRRERSEQHQTESPVVH